MFVIGVGLILKIFVKMHNVSMCYSAKINVTELICPFSPVK